VTSLESAVPWRHRHHLSNIYRLCLCAMQSRRTRRREAPTCYLSLDRGVRRDETNARLGYDEAARRRAPGRVARSSVSQPRRADARIFKSSSSADYPEISGRLNRNLRISTGSAAVAARRHRFGDGLHSRSRSRFRDRLHARFVPVQLAHRDIRKRKRTLTQPWNRGAKPMP
jgi:hypothetical protein